MLHIFCTFLCPCFARLQRKTSRNFLVTRFLDEMSNVVRQFLFIFFFSLPLIFTLEAASCLFSFSHWRYKIFMLFFQQKNASFAFCLSCQLSVALLLVKLNWFVAYFLFFSVFLFLNISVFVDMTINVSLILQTTRIQRQFPLSVFVCCLCITRRAWLCDFPPK